MSDRLVRVEELLATRRMTLLTRGDAEWLVSEVRHWRNASHHVAHVAEIWQKDAESAEAEVSRLRGLLDEATELLHAVLQNCCVEDAHAFLARESAGDLREQGGE